MTTPRRFRFAPTPSRELHAGSALAAICGWAACRAVAGHFIVRVEDIDRARSRPELEPRLFDDLVWLGLDWDEPPERQSDRLQLYDHALDALVADGRAYPCRCSRADIRAAQSAPHLAVAGEEVEVPYPGTCRGHAVELPADRGGYRFDVCALGDAAVVDWRDGFIGPQREDVRTTSGDFLLGRAQQPTYQLAVVVDDRLMGITDVVRGRDLLGSTARQILLHRALAGLPGASPAPTPTFAHHPLIIDADGRKLSKRDAALSLHALRRDGTDPRTLVARLGRAIGLFDAGVLSATPRDWADALASGDRAAALHDGRLHS